MVNEKDKIITYIQALLQNANVEEALPEDLREIEGVAEIDEALRNLRHAIRSISDGDLSNQLTGKGYLMGTVKNLQATLRTLIWQTKAIASGDFSNRVEFLGEFSDAFNSMVQELERIIAEQKDLENN
jgi:methyl-accepting chemotaxis protein